MMLNIKDFMNVFFFNFRFHYESVSCVKTIGVRDDHSYAIYDATLPMEEDDPNDPGDKLNDSVNSVLATPLEPDFKDELTNIELVPSRQDDENSKGNANFSIRSNFF